MSENNTPQAADETTEAQLTDSQLEEVAGGGILEDIAQAVIDYIKPDMPTVY